MLTIVHAGEDNEEKPKRSSRKKKAEEKPIEDVAPVAQQLESEPRQAGVEENISEPIAMTAIAQYDAKADKWVPKVIDGVEITAEVVNAIMAGGASYPMEVMTFVYDLSESERKVLCAQFSDETMEESND